MLRVKNDRRALGLGLLAVFFWSTAATAFKFALATLSVLQLLCVAVWTSALVLLVALALQGRLGALLQMLRSAPAVTLAMGCLNPLLYYCVLLAAYDLLPAQQAQSINYTWAITLALLSIPALGNRLGARDWLAIVTGYLGVLIIATEGNPLGLEFTSAPGVALALCSTFIWALFWICSTRSEQEPGVALTGYFLVAAPLSLGLCLAWGGGLPELSPSLLSAVYVGIFEMGLTYLLWSSALRSASNVSRVGNLIFLAPLLSLLFIGNVLDETIHPATLLGLVLILPGIFVQQRGGVTPDS